MEQGSVDPARGRQIHGSWTLPPGPGQRACVRGPPPVRGLDLCLRAAPSENPEARRCEKM
eukprot:9440642-Pyramimonas_sp.AAC.1